MLHYVYVIENLVNGKIYIGKHSTNRIDDGYLGSGTAIRAAIKKYGVECFKKTIIKESETEEEALKVEGQIVDEDFVSSKMTYNLIPGGKRGGIPGSDARSRAMKTRWKNPEYRKFMSKVSSDANRGKDNGKYLIEYYRHAERKHSEETKRKIGISNSKRQMGSSNSQFGTVWIYSPEEKRSMKVKREEFEWYSERGWLKGRKIKF